MSQHANQTIRRWSLTGNDRIIGAVYNRPGHMDGRTIMTSPVVQVRLMGPHKHPVAFTESGSIYWLGEPSEALGMDRAVSFIREKSRQPVHEPEAADPELRTTMAQQLA